MLQYSFIPESIGKLTNSLINIDGTPTYVLTELYDKYYNNNKQSNNECEIYNFILKNI